MGTARNVASDAVGTIEWLASSASSIVVPVYQRQYRWDIGGCEKLLTDIRTVADAEEGHTHFLGSILSAGTSGDSRELVLIDGQQRITTLMLLVAALQHIVRADRPGLAADLQRVLVPPTDPTRTKLRPNRAWADVFERVVLDRTDTGRSRDSRFDDNYAFFRSQIRKDDVDRIWRGLHRLEHVAITLGPDANAQQTFESLNSTGEPLRDHELIHNYVLMGLTHVEQSEVEDDFWLPIEENTGDAIGAFWRHFMIMITGREAAFRGERGVYDAFRAHFPRLHLRELREHAAEWKEFSGIYRVLLEPHLASDEALSRQLGYLNTFGRDAYPLLMRIYRDYLRGSIAPEEAIAEFERIQSLLLRREIVGVKSDRLVARLCRARMHGTVELDRAIARITPSDERVRVALKYRALPHAPYVLGRLAGLSSLAGIGIEHIVPTEPGDTWSGDGRRTWSEYTEDEQNAHRALAGTLGNLALIEDSLAEQLFGRSFPEKRDVFARSRVDATASLGKVTSWGTAQIAERTAELTGRLLLVWRRKIVTDIDDDNMTPILDAIPRRGWPRGWEREYEYVRFRRERWDVPDVKYLFNRVFTRLWAETPQTRAAVVAFAERRGGPVYGEQSWHGEWDVLDEKHSLYMGWDSHYMLTAVQGVLDEAGLAEDVFLKYSYIGEVM